MPAAVILYALLAVLAWPTEEERGSVAASSPLRPLAVGAWLALWGSEAYFALLPANRSAASLHYAVAGLADGEPHWLGSLDRWAAAALSHGGAAGGFALGALLIVVALGVLAPRRLARAALALAVVVSAATWLVGQDLGGILGGQATDPNSGLLLLLLAPAYRPLRRSHAAHRS